MKKSGVDSSFVQLCTSSNSHNSYTLDTSGQSKQVDIVIIGVPNSTIRVKISVSHKAPGTTSLVRIRAILFDNAHVEIDGVLSAGVNANNTTGTLDVKAIIVGSNTTFRATPALAVSEHQTNFTHSVTVERIPTSQLFYLGTRNLPETEASRLILESFVETICNRAKHSSRTIINNAIKCGLSHGHQATSTANTISNLSPKSPRKTAGLS